MKEQSDVQMRAERRVGVKQSVVKVCLLVSRLRIESPLSEQETWEKRHPISHERKRSEKSRRWSFRIACD